MRIAVIPARGGSKRIKDKNIRSFAGKPIISWAINNALKTGIFDKVLVSTDSKKIMNVALNLGAHVPFLRPSQLSGDYASTASVISHAIDWFEGRGETLSEVCCIYPVTPFLKKEDLLRGLKALNKNKDRFVYSITSYPHPIQRALTINDTGLVESINKKSTKLRTQDLDDTYHDAGQFYWATTKVWKSKSNILEEQSVGIFIPRYRAIDIDTWEDWEFAENIFKANHKKK